jgi:hypothetical protein
MQAKRVGVAVLQTVIASILAAFIAYNLTPHGVFDNAMGFGSVSFAFWAISDIRSSRKRLARYRRPVTTTATRRTDQS